MATVGKEVGAKLSALTFGWDKPAIQKAVLTDQEAQVHLYRIVGVVTGLKPYKDKETGETKFGSLGQFEMISPDGETAQGTVFYPPSYIQQMLESAFSMSDDVSSVRIGYDVYARYNDKSATSYAFVAYDLLNTGNETVETIKETVMALPMPGKGPLKIEDKSKK